MDSGVAERELLRCCGSSRWAERMAKARPFDSVAAMRVTADAIWAALAESDWREAFAAHPKIGAGGAGGAGMAGLSRRSREAAKADGSDLSRRSAQREGGWSSHEQAGVASASDSVLDRLAAKNEEYAARFGYIFIVCATGKSADEMLAILERRLANDATLEIRLAAEEQRKITQLRLEKLMAESDIR